MRKRIATLSICLLAVAFIDSGAAPLDALSDEFDNPATLTNWTRVKDAESWPNEQLEQLDIGVGRSGWLTMMPYTCTWFEDYRGPFLFKEVTGDFVATVSIEASNRAETGPPAPIFSLSGILTRAPRSVTPATWARGGEKYSFLSIGTGGDANTFQFEVKTTGQFDGDPESDSVLIYTDTDCACGEALIQTARIGQYIIQLRKTSTGVWTVHQRYSRPDFPATVQVGMFTYTDWPTVSGYTYEAHNSATITHEAGNPGAPSNPDLIARYDYFHFVEPIVPPQFSASDFTNPGEVSDAELLSFLGANAPQPMASVESWQLF